MTRHLRVVGDGEEPPADDDRAWFEQNPYAEFRVRPYRQGENPDPGPVPAGFELWVRITQVIPGVRYRQVGYARPGEIPSTWEPGIDSDVTRRIDAIKANYTPNT